MCVCVVFYYFPKIAMKSMCGRLTEEHVIDSNVREINDVIAECIKAKEDVFNTVAPELLQYIMEHYLDQPADIKNERKIESNESFMLMMLAVSKVDEQLFHGLLWCSKNTYRMPLVVLYLKAIETVYWSENVLGIFDSFMRVYPDDIIFRMLHRATKSSLTSTKKFVDDIFVGNTKYYVAHIDEISAQLEDVKLLAETGRYEEAGREYWELTCNFPRQPPK